MMEKVQRLSRAAAWAVHAFSASGAVLALLAVLAIDRHAWTEAMLWLFAALVTVSFPVEVWRQPRVPDSGASVIEAVVEPAI